MTTATSIAPLYRGWQLANERLVTALRSLRPEQLALPVGSPTWPIWASASHLAGARVYWLCHVFKEPGAETTPFTDPQPVVRRGDLLFVCCNFLRSSRQAG